MANPFTLPTISGFNANPPTDDGAQTANNTAEWQKHLDKIGTPLKVLVEQLGVNTQAAFNTIVSGGGTLTAGTTLASTGTTDVLGAATFFVTVSGTGTITSLGTGANRIRFVTATGAFTLTHNATSLILPGGVNIVAAAGDTFIVISDGDSNARVVSYQRATPFSGARVSLSANQSIPDATSTVVSWGTEDEDEGGWWDVGAPTRLTVPAGVTRVRVTAGVRWDAVAAGARHAEFRKNSAAVAGAGSSFMPGVSNGTHQIITSAWLTVTAGDFFEVRVFHTRGGGAALDLVDAEATFFSIEAHGG